MWKWCQNQSVFFFSANSQLFCPRKTLSPSPSPSHSPPQNTHMWTHTHTPLPSLSLCRVQNMWLRWTETLCHQGNNQLQTPSALASSEWGRNECAFAPCISSHASPFTWTQIVFELYSLKNTQNVMLPIITQPQFTDKAVELSKANKFPSLSPLLTVAEVTPPGVWLVGQ